MRDFCLLLVAISCLVSADPSFAQPITNFPRTADEIAAGVIPKHTEFPPDAVGMLERYGAVGNGVANDDDAIQTAIAVARQGSQTIYLTQGRSYRFTRPIVLSHENRLRNIISPQIPAKSPFTISPKLIYAGPPDTFAIDSDGNGTIGHCLLQGFNLTFSDKRSRHGINFDNVAFSTVRGVHVYQADTAFRTARSWNMLLIDSHFTDNNIGWSVERELNASNVINTRFNRNEIAGIKLNATISALLFSGGSFDNNGIGVSHTGKHIDWIKFDGTYLENNRIGVSHSGTASSSNWIWSSFFQHLKRSEVWYQINTSGKLVVSFRDTTIDGQPEAGRKQLIVYKKGEFRPLIDNLSLSRGATLSNSGEDWKQHLNFRGHNDDSLHAEIAIQPSLQGLWSDLDGSNPLRYWRDGEGQLRIVGSISGGPTGTQPVFILKPTFRPTSEMEFAVITRNENGNLSIGTLRVQPDGMVQLVEGHVAIVYIDISMLSR